MSNQISPGLSRPLKWFYFLVLFALVFSGFGQMPIFKRYYLADIPGLAWTADFYITLYIHYVAAALFVGLSAYYLITRVFTGVLRPSLDRRAMWRGGIFIWMIFTGAILVARNLPVVLPGGLIIFATLAHVTGTMLFLILAATYFRMSRKPARERS
jgi:hypothetical protein